MLARGDMQRSSRHLIYHVTKCFVQCPYIQECWSGSLLHREADTCKLGVGCRHRSTLSLRPTNASDAEAARKLERQHGETQVCIRGDLP